MCTGTGTQPWSDASAVGCNHDTSLGRFLQARYDRPPFIRSTHSRAKVLANLGDNAGIRALAGLPTGRSMCNIQSDSNEMPCMIASLVSRFLLFVGSLV
eukprot:scaffold13479_cov166-Amphora_coffeaeformis.AAC.11